MNRTTVTTLQVGIWLLTFFSGFYSGIAPPDSSLKLWPSFASILAVLGLFVYMNVGPRVRIFMIWIAIALALIVPIFYVWRYQSLTAKYVGSRIICGTELTKRGLEYQSQHPGISNEKLIFDFVGVTTDVWTESSINRARLTLGFSYSIGMGFLALASLIMLQKSKLTLSKIPAPHLHQNRPTEQTTDETDRRYDPDGIRSIPIEVFFSYARKDEPLRDEIAKHLRLLERQEIIRGWHDRKIGPGSKWKGVIDEHLKSARIILLLVSADFLASDYCYEVEMKTALELDEQRKARVIPIIVRHCDWQSSPFGHLQALPKDGRPIKQWRDRDAALKDIALGIKQAIKELVS